MNKSVISGLRLSYQPTHTLDYSKNFNWVNLPESIDKLVDVFYAYPTIYTGKEHANMDVYDVTLRAKAKGLAVAQAGVFANHTNLYAPFYRQQSAALQSMEAGDENTNALEDPIFKKGADDIEAAFDYYLAHHNQGRPFILASHSQGTMTLIALMRKRFSNATLQKQLVAAYLLGYSVTKNDLERYPWMKLAHGQKDTGVIITYNTEAENAGPSPVLLPGALAINPLNWKTDETPARDETHLGAKFFDDEKGKLLEAIPHFASAQVDTSRGVLIVSDMKTPSSEQIDLKNLGRWPDGVYHRYDYAFWWNNLTRNVADRIQAFLSI